MAFYNSISDQSNFLISFTLSPQQDFGVFAKGYAQAASVLAEQILGKPRFSDYEAYPVVFLYRQAFELYLKGFYFKARAIFYFKNSQNNVDCPFIYKHRLEPLAKTFQDICRVLFPDDEALLQLANKVLQYAIEFEQIDSNSFSYRYPIDTKGNPSTKHHQAVNLLAFHSCMQELLSELETVDFGFDVETSLAQEVYEILQDAERIIAS